jgi:hypothetical protein
VRVRRKRRCEIHDRAWPLIIRELEADLGYQPTAWGATFTENYCDPRLIDCGHRRCRQRREKTP